MKSMFILHYVCISLPFPSDKYGTFFPNTEKKSALYWECRNLKKIFSWICNNQEKVFEYVNCEYLYKWSSVETYSVWNLTLWSAAETFDCEQ